MYVGTRLVTEQQTRFVSTGVHLGHRTTALSGTSVVRKGKGRTAPERTFCGSSVRPEHGVEGGIASDLPAQVVQAVFLQAVRWNKRTGTFSSLPQTSHKLHWSYLFCFPRKFNVLKIWNNLLKHPNLWLYYSFNSFEPNTTKFPVHYFIIYNKSIEPNTVYKLHYSFPRILIYNFKLAVVILVLL
jgi:hypothetical protein